MLRRLQRLRRSRRISRRLVRSSASIGASSAGAGSAAEAQLESRETATTAAVVGRPRISQVLPAAGPAVPRACLSQVIEGVSFGRGLLGGEASHTQGSRLEKFTL